MTAFVYVLSNDRNNVLYVGSTDDLGKRMYFHKRGLLKGFTERYNVKKLVYIESHSDIMAARKREKAIKGGSRKKKVLLITSQNPHWKDLGVTS